MLFHFFLIVFGLVHRLCGCFISEKKVVVIFCVVWPFIHLQFFCIT